MVCKRKGKWPGLQNTFATQKYPCRIRQPQKSKEKIRPAPKKMHMQSYNLSDFAGERRLLRFFVFFLIST